VILPGLSPLEQPHYDDLIWSWAIRNAGKYSPALFEPEAGRPAEWQILLTLAALLQGQKAEDVNVRALDDLYFAGLAALLTQLDDSPIRGRDPAQILAETPGCGPERILDLQIRTGPWGDAYGARPEGLRLEHLRERPNGVDCGALEPRLQEVLRTPSGQVELAPPYLTADVARLRQRLGRSEAELVLVSRRQLRSNNSWLHNVPALMTGRERCTLLVHPRDARRLGLREGSCARVRSKVGELAVPVEISDEMMPGVVCLPHGFGHHRPGTRLRVASARPGVCNNLLAPGELLDRPSGNAVVNGIPVEVAPA